MIFNTKYIYKSLNGHIIVPIARQITYYICKVYYTTEDKIFDQGLYGYTLDGKCLEGNGSRNANVRVYLKYLPKNLQKMIKTDKKKGKNYV